MGIEAAIAHARLVEAGRFQLRLASPGDLLVLKVAAAEEPSRRPSKRRQDLLDIVMLVEEFPAVGLETPDLRGRVDRLTQELLTLGPERK